eukprot:Opistho-2@91626
MTSKDNEARRQIVFELLETERNYVNNLSVVMQFFLYPLNNMIARNERILNEKQVSMIFSNIEAIYKVNRKLLSSLEERIARWSPSQTIGDVFLLHAESLRKYGPFITAKDNSLERLREYEKTNPNFRNFLQLAHQRKECHKQELSDLLIQPVQRIPRYILLLKELSKRTPVIHPDSVRLDEAIAKMSEITQHLNDTKKQTDESLELFAVFDSIQKFPPELIAAHRRHVITIDVMQQATEKDQLTQPKPVGLILFSDVIVFAKIIATGPMAAVRSLMSGPTKARYRFIEKAPINTIRLIDAPDIQEFRNVFAISIGDEALRIYAAQSSSDKARFVALVEKAGGLIGDREEQTAADRAEQAGEFATAVRRTSSWDRFGQKLKATGTRLNRPGSLMALTPKKVFGLGRTGSGKVRRGEMSSSNVSEESDVDGAAADVRARRKHFVESHSLSAVSDDQPPPASIDAFRRASDSDVPPMARGGSFVSHIGPISEEVAHARAQVEDSASVASRSSAQDTDDSASGRVLGQQQTSSMSSLHTLSAGERAERRRSRRSTMHGRRSITYPGRQSQFDTSTVQDILEQVSSKRRSLLPPQAAPQDDGPQSQDPTNTLPHGDVPKDRLSLSRSPSHARQIGSGTTPTRGPADANGGLVDAAAGLAEAAAARDDTTARIARELHELSELRESQVRALIEGFQDSVVAERSGRPSSSGGALEKPPARGENAGGENGENRNISIGDINRRLSSLLLDGWTAINSTSSASPDRIAQLAQADHKGETRTSPRKRRVGRKRYLRNWPDSKGITSGESTADTEEGEVAPPEPRALSTGGKQAHAQRRSGSAGWTERRSASALALGDKGRRLSADFAAELALHSPSHGSVGNGAPVTLASHTPLTPGSAGGATPGSAARRSRGRASGGESKRSISHSFTLSSKTPSVAEVDAREYEQRALKSIGEFSAVARAERGFPGADSNMRRRSGETEASQQQQQQQLRRSPSRTSSSASLTLTQRRSIGDMVHELEAETSSIKAERDALRREREEVEATLDAVRQEWQESLRREKELSDFNLLLSKQLYAALSSRAGDEELRRLVDGVMREVTELRATIASTAPAPPSFDTYETRI